MFYSPLRYPGGKNRLAKFIAKVCVDNNINGHYVEPYAGGASVALYLLIEGFVEKITINDKDKSIYAFWYSVLYRTDELCELIENTEINIKNWEKQKEVQKNKEQESDLLKLGFSTFFLNRTNRSGIINAGPIGGKNQKGNYKIDVRFNKDELVKRIKKIAKYKGKIILRDIDAIDLIKEIKKESNNKNTIFYFDPPYYLKGPGLYMNSYKDYDHKKVAEEIRKIKKVHWIVSYDNTPQIVKFYNWVKNRFEFNLTHFAFKTRQGKEILFFSNTLKSVDFNLIKK